MNRKIRESGLDATTRYELHMRLNGMREHEKICHGDFNPSNVIVTPDGDWYVIDWSHVTQGNASADAARTYLLFCLNGKEDVANSTCRFSAKRTTLQSSMCVLGCRLWQLPSLERARKTNGNFCCVGRTWYSMNKLLPDEKTGSPPIFIKSCKCPVDAYSFFVVGKMI